MDRIRKLCRSLQNVDGCLLENPVDLLYLTGLAMSKGRLWASAKDAVLFVDGRYLEKAKKEAPCTVSEDKNLPEILKKEKKIGFDSSFITYENYLLLQSYGPKNEWIPIPNPLKTIRGCKEKSEVEALQKAQRLTWEGYQHVLSLLKEGITELEIALEFEIYCRKRGASALSFQSIVAFGENSAYPHYRAGNTKLKKNQIVLMDLGAVLDQYHGDMTRVSFFGTADSKLEKFLRLVRESHDKVIAHIRPGIVIKEVDLIAREVFRNEGVEHLFTHSLGHGIGLDTHEYPVLRFDGKDADIPLQEGMVITIEPGLYQPGLGGVRWENMGLVTKDGFKNFLA